jgi:phosphoglycerate kinase
MDFKTLLEADSLEGKRVLVRVDWNVPIKEGQVTDDYRIRHSQQTIEYLKKAGARIILIGHLESKETHSFEGVYEHAKTILPLTFVPDLLGEQAKRAVDSLQNGEVLLLENVRTDPREKENQRDFALALSQYADLYVNEAFSNSHRNHASIVGIPKLLPSFGGLRFTEEVKRLSKAFYPKHPFLFILGGAKFDTKIPLIKKFNAIADNLFVGGALAHNFFVEQGASVEASLVSEGHYNLQEIYNAGKVVLPEDLVIKDKEGNNRTDGLEHLVEGDVIVDAGPKTLEHLEQKIASSEFILWNGPVGNYEQGYKDGTLALANMLAHCEKEVIVGGADTLSAIKELNVLDKFSFASTGGGAMLDFLAQGTLPGIEALKKL